MSDFWQSTGNRNTDAAQQQILALQAALDGPLPLRTLSVAQSATIDANARCIRYVGNSASDVLTLPTANALGAGVGQLVALVNTSAVAISVVPSGSDTLNKVTTAYVLAAGSQVIFVADAQGGWWATVVVVPPTPPPAPDIQEFSANGTWTKPANVGTYAPKWTRIELVPWGASGAGGGGGGGGGGASGVSQYEILTSLLGATETVTFGAQPNGGAGGVSPAAGTNGTDAPDATFGAWLRAAGGKKGIAAGAGGAGGYGNMGTGGAGGSSGAGAVGTGRAGGGGGANASAGGNAGPDRATNLTGGAAGAAGAPGTAGTNGSVGEVGGGGGGGGGGDTAGAGGGAGADGGRYGAGGGAGGNPSFGNTGGVGGKGGPCFARVTTWYV